MLRGRNTSLMCHIKSNWDARNHKHFVLCLDVVLWLNYSPGFLWTPSSVDWLILWSPCDFCNPVSVEICQSLQLKACSRWYVYPQTCRMFAALSWGYCFTTSTTFSCPIRTERCLCCRKKLQPFSKTPAAVHIANILHHELKIKRLFRKYKGGMNIYWVCTLQSHLIRYNHRESVERSVHKEI